MADDYGVSLWNRMFHRLTLDQKVFKRRIKRPSRIGVLLDVSASMEYSEEDIERLLTTLPPGSVAAFYGAGGSPMSAFIDVIADGVRRASKFDSSLYRQENLCDLPALEWLLAQNVDERFWVSDGLATMVGGDGHEYFDGGISQFFAIENGIRRVETIDEIWE